MNDRSIDPAASARLTYLGHASLHIAMGNTNLLTDPVFSNRIFHLRRSVPAPDLASLPRMDALLISHLHYDHLDLSTLRRFGDSPVVYLPHGAGKLLERAGLQNYRHVQAGDRLTIGEVTVEVVNSVHTNSRHPLGMHADTLGYLICGPCKVYFPGDTVFFPEMAAFSDNLDLAFLHVWGWGPDRGRMHLGPREAAQALTVLKPQVAIPIHWGTYLPIGMLPLNPRFHRTPPVEFAEFAHQVAPHVEVRILRPGESTRIEPGSGM